MKKCFFKTGAAAILVSLLFPSAVLAVENGRLGTDIDIVRQEDGSYRWFETYEKEDGTQAKNEWIQLDDTMGVKIWKYFGADGYVLVDTASPDGYLLNSRGEWYKNSPEAIIAEVDDYHCENAYYPFSYDGETFKNDHLGIIGKYGADDAAAGYQLQIYDKQNAMDYAAFGVTGPDGSKAVLRISPNGSLAEDGYINKRIEDLSESDRHIDCTASFKEKTIGGKPFKGYTMITIFHPSESGKLEAGAGADSCLSVPGSNNEDGRESIIAESSSMDAGFAYSDGKVSLKKMDTDKVERMSRFYALNVDGSCYELEINYTSEAGEEPLIQWLNQHVTFTK